MHDDFQCNIGADLFADAAIFRKLGDAVLLARIEKAHQKIRREHFNQLGLRQRVIQFFRRHTQADRRDNSIARRADFYCHSTTLGNLHGFRQRTGKTQRDRLPEFLTRRQYIRPGPRERAHVGFERGVGPVAMIFHLKRIAFHHASRPNTRQHFVRQRANISIRAIGIDVLRKITVGDAAIDMLDFHRLTDNAL